MRSEISPSFRKYVILYFSICISYFTVFWSRAFWFDADGNLLVGQINLWGDWALHFTMGSSMAIRKLFLSTSPLLIDAPFRYSFFPNWLSAVLIKCGIPFFKAFVWPSWFFCILSVVAIYYFFKVIFRSPLTAVLASFIYFLNGGLGFFYLFKNVGMEYCTHFRSSDIHWQSLLMSMFIPQRTFTHAFPIGVAILSFFSLKQKKLKISYVICAGFLIGLLPLVNIHSFISVGVILFIWAISELFIGPPFDHRVWLRKWGVCGFFSIALALFSMKNIFLLDGVKNGFMAWDLGWMTEGSFLDWVIFWIKNWGPTLACGCMGMMLIAFSKGRSVEERRRLVLIFSPFWILFILANLIRFQPWDWDNTKILAWSSLGISGLAGFFLVEIGVFKKVLKPLAIVLFFAMTFSGGYDAVQIIRKLRPGSEMYSREDLELAEWVKSNTPVDSIWLTGPYPDHWLPNLTGRQSLMSFTGWLWTHGYNFSSVERDVKAMFQDPGLTDLFKKYRVSYVVIGRFEMDVMKANEADYSLIFTPVYKSKHTTIYKTIRQDPLLAKKRSLRISPLSNPPKELSKGLLLYRYKSRNFSGASIIGEKDPGFNFHYDANIPRPFSTPCSMVWKGFLRITKEDLYTFKVNSDDGGWLYLNDQMIVENGGEHEIKEKFGRVNLTVGLYKVELRYFDAGGGAILNVQFSSNGAPLKTFGDAQLYH